MLKLFQLRSGATNNALADIVDAPTSYFNDPVSGEERREFHPGKIVFKWSEDHKRRPDFIRVVSYYPVVSTRVKEFFESSGFSGVEFNTALELSEAESDWWVMCPSTRMSVDLDAFCGPNAKIDPATKHIVLSPGGAGPFPRAIRLKEDLNADFFGIADLPWHPGMFCGVEAADLIKQQKFSNVKLKECKVL